MFLYFSPHSLRVGENSCKSVVQLKETLLDSRSHTNFQTSYIAHQPSSAAILLETVPPSHPLQCWNSGEISGSSFQHCMWGGWSLHSRLALAQKRQKCKFVPRLESMIVEAKSYTRGRFNVTNWRYSVYSWDTKCRKPVFKLGKTQYMCRLLLLEALKNFEEA